MNPHEMSPLDMNLMSLGVSLVYLLSDTDTHIQRYAKLAQEIKDGLESGRLTEQEYIELMVDLRGFESVIATSSMLRLQATIRSVTEGLIELAKVCKPM